MNHFFKPLLLLCLLLCSYLTLAADTMPISVISPQGAFENRNFANGAEIFTNRNYVLQNIPSEFAGFEFLASDGKVADQGFIIPSASGTIYLIGPSSGVTGWSLVPNTAFNYSDGASTSLAIYQKTVTANESVEIPLNTSFPGVGPIAQSIVFEQLDLFLCIGQSNMAGRDDMNAALGDFIPVDNAYLLANDGFIDAVNPFNGYTNIGSTSFNGQGVSPSFSFSKEVASSINNKIGLVVNARGGSSINSWNDKTDDLYAQTIVRALEAQKWGTYKAILWHQGESNSGTLGVEQYPERLQSLVANLREDLGDPNLLFVAGQIGQFKSSHANFNAMITTVPTFIDNTACVLSDGLTDNGDGLHFSRESYLTLGQRYADIVLDRVYNQTSTTAPLVNFVTPIDGTAFTAGHDLVVTVDATDSNGSIDNVQLFINNLLVRQENYATYDWGQNVQDPLLADLAAGTYTLKAVATDNDGETSEASIDITVDNGNPTGAFFLQNLASGEMLKSDDNGAIGLYAPSTSEDHQWNFIPTSDGYVMLDNANPQRGPIKTATTTGNPLVWLAERFLGNAYLNREWLPIWVSGNIYKLECRDAGRGYIAAIGGNAINSADGNDATAHWELIPSGDSSFKAASNVIDINKGDLVNQLVMYPNPTSDTLYIELKGISNAEISILDIGGQLIWQEKYTGGTMSINTRETLKTGIYIVKSMSEKGVVLTQKLVIF
ncbi:sialate O-acetylesterase [Nonlabens xiamenensis]|uniref:sialate O-acetylesterase n=1 Tax=Nonlabens xiamenensis TaxID=2341043 RepID=UPI000F60DD9A|nr:sialate O-acetylesterase [Nonlabens xiamenensis]